MMNGYSIPLLNSTEEPLIPLVFTPTLCITRNRRVPPSGPSGKAALNQGLCTGAGINAVLHP
jgi:hypothetical protein